MSNDFLVVNTKRFLQQQVPEDKKDITTQQKTFWLNVGLEFSLVEKTNKTTKMKI